MRRTAARPPRQRLAQRGQIILGILAILGIGFGLAFYTFYGPTGTTIERDKINSAALAQAREALIGYAANGDYPGPMVTGCSTPNTNWRPGELPCPDTDNDGNAQCTCSAGTLGRIPWKTLKIPEPKDSAGETLWYAVAGPFRRYASNTNPITSDTQGNLTVYQGSSATTLTSQAIAVIFAPGLSLGTQNRSSTTSALCSTTGTTIAYNLCAGNYLEATSGINNAQTNGPFIQAQTSTSFNDSLLAITNIDLMPVVEQHVAREMISYLNSYRAAVGVYPWADLGDGNSNSAPFSAAYNRNRFPCNNADPTNWGNGGTPNLPNWLTNGCLTGSPVSGWSAVIYYAVARNRLQASGTGCTTCTASSLSVTNSTNGLAIQCTTASPPVCTPTIVSTGSADLLLITPGGYTGSPARSWSQSSWTTITGYFVDSNSTVSTENRDNNDDIFYVPSTTNNNRARMFIVR